MRTPNILSTIVIGIHVSQNSLEPLAQGLKISSPNRDMRLPQFGEQTKTITKACWSDNDFQSISSTSRWKALPWRSRLLQLIPFLFCHCTMAKALQRSSHKFQKAIGWIDRGMISRNTADFQAIFSTVFPAVLMPWAVAGQHWMQHGQRVRRFQLNSFPASNIAM